MRSVRGVTLTPEERKQAGYDQASGGGPTLHQHTCSITLPDERACQVSYRRYSRQSHQFDFAHPLGERIWVTETVEGSVAAIEAKAAEIAPQAFRQAQAAEQQAMRRKTDPARGSRSKREVRPEIEAKVAQQLAGNYAPCMRFKSGRLIRIGGVYEQPDGAVQEIATGRHSGLRLMNGQRLVVGICNGLLRRWQEPEFLAVPQAPEPKAGETAGSKKRRSASKPYHPHKPC